MKELKFWLQTNKKAGLLEDSIKLYKIFVDRVPSLRSEFYNNIAQIYKELKDNENAAKFEEMAEVYKQ